MWRRWVEQDWLDKYLVFSARRFHCQGMWNFTSWQNVIAQSTSRLQVVYWILTATNCASEHICTDCSQWIVSDEYPNSQWTVRLRIIYNLHSDTYPRILIAVAWRCRLIAACPWAFVRVFFLSSSVLFVLRYSSKAHSLQTFSGICQIFNSSINILHPSHTTTQSEFW